MLGHTNEQWLRDVMKCTGSNYMMQDKYVGIKKDSYTSNFYCILLKHIYLKKPRPNKSLETML